MYVLMFTCTYAYNWWSCIRLIATNAQHIQTFISYTRNASDLLLKVSDEV